MLRAVSSQVPATQRREEVHVDLGAAVAVMTLVTDFLAGYPYSACRWRQLASMALPLRQLPQRSTAASTLLLESHVVPWLVGRCGVGLTAWDGAGWAVAAAVVTAGTGAAVKSTTVVPSIIRDIMVSLVTFPLSIACLRSALFGSMETERRLQHSSSMSTEDLAGLWTGEERGLLAVNVGFMAIKQQLYAATYRLLLKEIQNQSPNGREPMDAYEIFVCCCYLYFLLACASVYFALFESYKGILVDFLTLFTDTCCTFW